MKKLILVLLLCAGASLLCMESNNEKAIGHNAADAAQAMSSTISDKAQKKGRKHNKHHSLSSSYQKTLISSSDMSADLLKKLVKQQEELVKQSQRAADAQELQALVGVLMNYKHLNERYVELTVAEKHSTLAKRKSLEGSGIVSVVTEMSLYSRYMQLLTKIKSEKIQPL